MLIELLLTSGLVVCVASFRHIYVFPMMKNEPNHYEIDTQNFNQ